MAYLGSTQASSIANPPMVMWAVHGASADTRIAGSTGLFLSNNYGASSTATYKEGAAFGGRIWAYYTTDTSTAVLNSGYITDAGPLGMRPMDALMVMAVATTASTNACMRWCYVTSITTAGAAVLSSGMTSTS
jgi:hypothetical protein